MNSKFLNNCGILKLQFENEFEMESGNAGCHAGDILLSFEKALNCRARSSVAYKL